MESLMVERQLNGGNVNLSEAGAASSVGSSEDECGGRVSAHMSVSSEPISQRNRGMSVLYHGTWPVERTMWNSEPTNLTPNNNHQQSNHLQEVTSVMSFASSSGGAPLDRVLSNSPNRSRRSSQQLEAKVDMVYSLLAMLGGQEHADMGETLLALSTNPESCLAMRQSGCIPLLVQLVQSDRDADTRNKASQALNNLVHSQTDEKIRKRETRVLKLLEHTRAYTDAIRNNLEFELDTSTSSEDSDKHPVQTIAHLMKLSFDEGHRQAICQLGGIHITASLVEAEHVNHGSTADESQCILMRRYACMALTNLTFGDSGNKALLCSYREFMRALVVQLQSPSDELRQVTASVLRNLSWRADSTSKDILREVGSVTGLMKSAMLDNKENTLKSILSALWNLSAHCTENKSEICAVEHALGFLVDMLTYKTPTKSLAIIENSGGILRNISSQIAVRDDYREILRQHNCLQILLDQLKSPSLTIVSNACGTLWNLSAKCAADQEALWKMGAPAMLRSLNHSKHKMIAMGSSAALKNLLSAKPSQTLVPLMDRTARAMDLPTLPTLGARKQKALLQDLDQNLSETYENIDKESPVKENNNNKKDFIYCDDLSNNFSSLNLNTPSTSGCYSNHISQNYGSTSLPFTTTSQKHNYLPVLNKFSDCDYEEDEIETSDQPIDYSQKYSEAKSIKKPNKPEKSEDIYAETDLDQPTDYSLRYAEDDSDSEACNKIVKSAEFIQDTVKTYCTEDTPYETPLNFSNATSMSDLRIDNDKLSVSATKPTPKEIAAHLDEKDHCSTEDISEIDNKQKTVEKNCKSELSSGLLTPEKPVNYCEEGTPGCFSRVSSFSSLNSNPVNEKSDKKSTVPIEEQQEKEKVGQQKSPGETKVVKFEQVVNYAEETPLMFSRSSSMTSLDSIEQNSFHDDRSSVVSDFSRLTSGVISPSELPDSPFQTVPPSPKPRKSPLDYPSTSKQRSSVEKQPQPAPRSISKPSSIFEDNVKKFKEESTPIQFSTATSLSNLTIDDEIEAQNCIIPKQQHSEEDNTLQKEELTEKQDVDNEKEAGGLQVNEDIPQVSEDEGDDDILAACINSGMQNNRYCQGKPTTPTSTKLPLSNLKHQQKPSGSSIPLPRSAPRNIPPPNNVRPSNNDCVYTYCTEGTPAALSHAGSNSDLSILSIPTGNESKINLSDDSNLSESENLLAQCIQSAMPKPKKDLIIASTSSGSKQSTSNLPRRNLSGNSRSEACKARSSSRENKANSRTSGQQQNNLCKFSRVDDTAGTNRNPEKIRAISNPGNFNISPEKDETRQESPSSLESTEVSEDDLVLLEQCISLGMQKSKENAMELSQADKDLLQQCISSAMPKTPLNNVISSTTTITSRPIGIATKQFANNKTSDNDNFDIISKPKNGNAASVVVNTTLITNNNVDLELKTTVADGLESTRRTGNTIEICSKPEIQAEIQRGTSQDKCSPLEENLLTDLTKSGSNKSLGKILDNLSPEYSYSNSDNCANFEAVCLSKSCEDSSKIVDNRMLDPDAMIESLDRFTAELVSQASHLNKDDKFRTSTSDNTWNEDTSPNELTFPSISGSTPNVITFDNSGEAAYMPNNCIAEQQSNDFSSINTSTMTESTLIAIEATKIATVFQNEAEMSYSITSAASLELDQVQPPSQMNSLTNSYIKETLLNSPKLVRRKKSLPAGLMVRRALSNSLNHGSSIESLDNNSLSNLDHMNPPSALGEVFDMENSMTSISSLPSENGDVKPDFILNGIVNKDIHQVNPIFTVKQPANMLHLLGDNNAQSYSDIEQINPPSLFNEITDMCNSLADVTTDAIGSETEIFEDCFTHVADNTLQTEDDLTEFSDANSVTPIQSDINSSSNESTPKKTKGVSKPMTMKQRRSLAKERYKTYTIGAEMIMKEEEIIHSLSNSVTEDYKTAVDETNITQDTSESLTYVSPTFSIKESSTSKLTPKERRKNDRSRFETRVVDEATTNLLQQPVIIDDAPQQQSPQGSPVRSKLSIRRNFAQKRLENKDRFRTQTISESSISPEVSCSSPVANGENDLHLLVQKEANLVLKSLKETKTRDELLDCETLSLVSNDDDSDNNSGSSLNYRTYHKSWGLRTNNIPIVQTTLPSRHQSESCVNESTEHSDNSDNEQNKPPTKPKIVKPPCGNHVKEDDPPNEEPQVKAIRGRRKPLYSKTVAPVKKPIKTMTSNLVKNVTSTLKSGNALRSVITKQAKTVTTKPPTIPPNRIYGTRNLSNTTLPKTTSPLRSLKYNPKPPPTTTTKTPPLERQGTFTKDESTSATPKSKIPMSGLSKIPTNKSKIPSKLPQNNLMPRASSTSVKSASSDRANKNYRIYNRSTSADSRETTTTTRKIHTSSSNHSIKSDAGCKTTSNGAVKKSLLSPQRSGSNSSLNSNGSTSKKQVTSKIASLWKKIEQSKKQPPKKDTRVWIQPEQSTEPPKLIRSNTFDNKDSVVLRNKSASSDDQTEAPKRISRLGSFIITDESDVGYESQQLVNTDDLDSF